VANQFTETDETSIVRNIGRSRTHYSAGIESFDNLEVDAQAHDRVQQGEAFEERVNKDSSNWSEAKDLPRVGAVNYAKERNLRINNGNLDNEGVKNYNLGVKDYYFGNTLSPF
jgi:hypothetical protein